MLRYCFFAMSKSIGECSPYLKSILNAVLSATILVVSDFPLAIEESVEHVIGALACACFGAGHEDSAWLQATVQAADFATLAPVLEKGCRFFLCGSHHEPPDQI